jgi:hypothetical protein
MIADPKYIRDRNAFNSAHKASGNASFPAMRQAELEAFAKRGNVYAQHQLHNQGQADMAILSDQARAAEKEAHNWGVAAEVTDKIGDAVTGGAHRDLQRGAEQFQQGHYGEAAGSVLLAGGEITVSAAKTALADACVGLAVGKASSLLQTAGKAPVRAAGQLMEKYAERAVGWQNDYDDYLDPVRRGVLDITG